jgi:hypothetical protein
MGLFLGVEEQKLWPMNCSHTCLQLFGSVVLMNQVCNLTCLCAKDMQTCKEILTIKFYYILLKF